MEQPDDIVFSVDTTSADANNFSFTSFSSTLSNNLPGEISTISLVDSNDMPLTTPGFIDLINLPNNGLRTIISDYQYGAISAATGYKPFVIFTVSDYGRAFTLMQEVEKDLPDLMQSTLGTEVVAQDRMINDYVLSNVRVREVLSGDNSLIVYGFFNANTLVIAKDTDALSQIFTTLRRQVR